MFLTVRADANAETGYGHLYRTLLLVSEAVPLLKAVPEYVVNDESDISLIKEAGYRTLAVPTGMGIFESIERLRAPEEGLILIDNYDVTREDLEKFQKAHYCVALFDDGNRLSNYSCDLVIDSSPGAVDAGYATVGRTEFCLGPAYYPLRRGFKNHNSGTRSPGICITFGGSDPDDQTARVLSALLPTGIDCPIDAVLGPGYKGSARGDARVSIHRNPDNLGEIFGDATLAVCGGGGTAIELAYLGVPMIIVALADNQIQNAQALQEAEAAVYAGTWDQLTDTEILTLVESLLLDEARRERLSRNARKLVDGKGGLRLGKAVQRCWETFSAREHLATA